MKRILKLVLLAAAVFGVSSCYEDYVNDYDFPNIGFSMNRQIRTVVSTTNKIYVGVSIGGKRTIDMNDWANFVIDESILAGTGKKLLPEKYYTLSDPNTMRVRKSNLPVADVCLEFTDAFYADANCLSATYALPFRLVASSIPDKPDSLGNVNPYGAIRKGGETSVVAIKYICGFSGTYYKVGSVVEVDAAGEPIGEPVKYAEKDLMNNATVKLSTTGRYSVQRPGVGNISAGGLGLEVVPVDGAASYAVNVSAATGTTLMDGSVSASYVKAGDYKLYGGDEPAPQFNLEYIYVDGGKNFKVSEKLVLRQWAERELVVETF